MRRYFHPKVSAVLLVGLTGVYLIGALAVFFTAAHALQNGHHNGYSQFRLRAGLWHVTVAVLCWTSRQAIASGIARKAALSSVLAAAALFIAIRGWLPALEMQLGLLALVEPVLVFPIFAYVVATGYIHSRPKRN